MSKSHQLATFFVDGRMFGVDVLKVQEVMRYQEMTPVPLAPVVVEGLINLRGQIVTALDLRRRLDLAPRAEGTKPMNVVIRTAEGASSLLVDEIGDVVDVSDELYEEPPETLDGPIRALVAGVYKLEKGLLHVLNADRVVQFMDIKEVKR